MEKPSLEITTSTAHELEDVVSTCSRDPSLVESAGGDQGRKTWASLLFRFEHLDRVLERPQLTGIAFSGTVGIGLFVTSGEFIAISGSLGCVLAFIGAGTIVVSTMRSLAEMVSVRPLFNALIDYPHTFVDPALGFAVGVTYCLAQCLSMATLTTAAARVANNFYPNKGLTDSQLSGIITGFSVLTVLSNICGVKLYGNIERVCKWIKLLIIISLCILMVVINTANVGYRTNHPARNYTDYGLTPYYNPSGLLALESNQTDESKHGIPGAGGRFFAVWTSITLAVFVCTGGDIVIVSAGEAKNPRRDLPAAARFMYLAPIGFCILGSFLAGFNINYTDPDLYRPWSRSSAGYVSHSPFIIALKHSTIAPNVLPTLYNALFMFSAYTTANTGLFAASRTLFGIAKMYGTPFLKRTIGHTNAGHTPIAAIFCCSLFLLFAFLGLADTSFNQPILSMSSFYTGAIACVYGAECVAYLRFKKGLSLMEGGGLFSRDDERYKQKHYRAHWQPTFAIFGLVGCVLIMLSTGWPALYIICARNSLENGAQLKPNHLLLWDLIGTYAGPILFFSLYGIYKLKYRTTIRDPQNTNFRDAYILPEIDELETMSPITKRDWKFLIYETWSFIK